MEDRGLKLFGLTRTGEVFPAEVGISKSEFDGEIFYSAFIKNIAERVKAEAELVAATEQYSTLVENIPGGVFRFAFDEKFTTLFYSEYYSKLTGYAIQDFISGKKSFVDLIHPDDRERVLKDVDDAIIRVIRDSNNRVVDIILAKIHLIHGHMIPESYTRFLTHVAVWHAFWDNPNSDWSAYASLRDAHYAWSVYTSRREQHSLSAFSWAEVRHALFEARWELPLPFIFIGGIYGGLFTISEVAAITVCYVLFSQLLLYRELRPGQIPAIMVRSSVMVGEIILILAVSLAFTNVLVDAEVPMHLFESVRGNISNKYVFLLLLNLFLLMLGAVLDIFSALVIMVPLLLPIALSYGIDPVHLGIIFLANMQLGYFTPPVGMNLFIASFRFQQPILTLYSATLPFFFVLLIAVILITYIPWLSLWLPGQFQ